MTKNNMEPGISRNFIENLYSIAAFTGCGITYIERDAGVGTGYCAMCKLRNSSPTLRIADQFAKATGYTIAELIRDPKEFIREVLKL